MSDELRAAAERLRILWSGGTMDDAYGVNLSLEGQRTYCSFDMEILARAYLAEHPADDAEPVTEEWMRAVGAVGGGGAFGTIKTPYSADRVVLIEWRMPGVVHERQCGPSFNVTRGHVRRLCAALGVALKEPT